MASGSELRAVLRCCCGFPWFPAIACHCTAIFGRLYHNMIAGCFAYSTGKQQLNMRSEMHCRPRQATDGGRASVPLCSDVPNMVVLIWWLTFPTYSDSAADASQNISGRCPVPVLHYRCLEGNCVPNLFLHGGKRDMHPNLFRFVSDLLPTILYSKPRSPRPDARPQVVLRPPRSQ